MIVILLGDKRDFLWFDKLTISSLESLHMENTTSNPNKIFIVILVSASIATVIFFIGLIFFAMNPGMLSGLFIP